MAAGPARAAAKIHGPQAATMEGTRLTSGRYWKTGEAMNEIYTRQEAMDRLGLRSVNSFLQLERKYPYAFVVVKQGLNRKVGYDKHLRYDKATLDRFAAREHIKQEKP
jgi:hypothetical protein